MPAPNRKKTYSKNNGPMPPSSDSLPYINGSSEVDKWLSHYWQKLNLPASERAYLAVTQDRSEFAKWAGRRLNSMTLGCYCYLPPSRGKKAEVNNQVTSVAATQQSLFSTTQSTPAYLATPRELPKYHHHLIFVEPGLLPQGIEVTIAHELIHLSDRLKGQPRKHRCHGYDSIAEDEAAITEYPIEELRSLLNEETARREAALRTARPFRYLYQCKSCGKDYYRVRKYSHAVSCGKCSSRYNPSYALILIKELKH